MLVWFGGDTKPIPLLLFFKLAPAVEGDDEVAVSRYEVMSRYLEEPPFLFLDDDDATTTGGMWDEECRLESGYPLITARSLLLRCVAVRPPPPGPNDSGIDRADERRFEAIVLLPPDIHTSGLWELKRAVCSSFSDLSESPRRVDML